MFKAPVWIMMVYEKKAKFMSESGGKRMYSTEQDAKSSSMPTQTNMATESLQGIWYIEEERERKK